MKTWHDFYKDRVNQKYYGHIRNKYRDFIDQISHSIRASDVVVELGCGCSNVTRALMEEQRDAKYIVVDCDTAMLNLSLENLASSPVKKDVEVVEGNLLLGNYPGGDIAHSHGVLEHFCDYDIQRIINYQKSKFKQIFHYVPGIKYETPSFGDERLLRIEEWIEIANPTKTFQFNDGYDYILKWEQHEKF